MHTKKKYKWSPHHEQEVRKHFNSKGSKSLKNALKKVSDGHDRGEWINDNIYRVLKKKWQNPN